MTPLDWARRIAIHYRNTLAKVAPEECAHLDAQARAGNHHWLFPTTIPEVLGDLDDEYPAPIIEHYWQIPASTIRTWASRGIIKKRCADDGRIVYRLGDVLAAQTREPKTVDKPTVS